MQEIPSAGNIRKLEEEYYICFLSNFLSPAISLHVLLKTWYWTKHSLDLIWYGYHFALSSSHSILSRNQTLQSLTSHTNCEVYFNMRMYHTTFCGLQVLWNIMSIMYLSKSKGQDKQCKINLQIINRFKGILSCSPQILWKEILPVKDKFKSADAKWKNGVYRDPHYTVN